MSIRMFARRLSHVNVATGTDRVIFGISLPSGSVVHDISLQVSVVANTTFALGNAGLYACEGWILPIPDPDGSASYDDMWDLLVPKDTDSTTMDLDTLSVDATPFFEPGEPDLTGIFDVGVQPERLYKREKLLTAATGAISVARDPETPFAYESLLGDSFGIRIKRRLRVRNPSVLVFAVASPSMDDTVSVVDGHLLEAEWPQVKYIGNVLERAILHILGLVEAGAETPWEEAIVLLKKHLEPDPFEQSANNFISPTWIVTCKGIVDHSVTGNLQSATISTA